MNNNNINSQNNLKNNKSNINNTYNILKNQQHFKSYLVDCKIKLLKKSNIKDENMRDNLLDIDRIKIELANKKIEITKSIRNIKKCKENCCLNDASISDKINALSLSCLTVYDE